jgi:hypothetical protein
MEFKEVKNSGDKIKYKSGMVRNSQENKIRYDLISTLALERLAKHYTNGAKIYSENNGRNWELGGPFSRFYASMFRHLMSWREGDKSEDHLAALCWNAFCILHFEEEGKEEELNDLPYYKRGNNGSKKE